MILLGMIGNKPPPESPYLYSLKGKEERANLSLHALYRLLSPACSKVIIFGTKEAIETQAKDLECFRAELNLAGKTEAFSVKMIPTGQSKEESQAIFHDILAEIRQCGGQELCMDLTQGYRHQPTLMFLVGLLQGLSGIRLHLYYSMTKGLDEHSQTESFECVDIVSFLEIGYMSLVLQLFPTSFNIPSFIQLQQPEFNAVKEELNKVAQAILENNLDMAIKAAEGAEKKVDRFLTSKQGSFLQAQAEDTQQLLRELRQLRKDSKAQKMLWFGRMYLKRHYFLNAATFLYEGLLKLVREITKFDERCLQKGKQIAGLEYKASQTIKMLLQFSGGSVPGKTEKYVRLFDKDQKGEVADYLAPADTLRAFYRESLFPLQSMSRLIDAVDEIRNNAAHGFINQGRTTTYRNRLDAYFAFLEEFEKNFTMIDYRLILSGKIYALPGVVAPGNIRRNIK